MLLQGGLVFKKQSHTTLMLDQLSPFKQQRLESWVIGNFQLLGICCLDTDGIDQHVLNRKAEQWFQKILQVYNADFGMKPEDCEIFVAMDVDIRLQQIQLRQHVNHNRWKLQHGCTANSYREKSSVFVCQYCGIANKFLGHDFHYNLDQSMAHAQSLGYSSGLISS